MSEPSANGSTFTELILEVFRLNGLLLEAGDRLTHPVGLSSARWQVLGVVEHQPTSVAHVARIMGLSRQSVQQTANALAADGFIIYTDNPHHRRAKLMTLTPKGRKALDYVQHCQVDWANQVGDALSLEALRTAVTVLRQLEKHLEMHKPDVLDE
ncbi:MAG: MarR family transcriptional regulator [Oscillatoriophycideae cyanobacterium NC_groundwater_1537_Pr4_S-0.65um_50_18]|nr:MarR family transcriptional regulator [Oscillatoriophycideae cyanobacterium NC_groundwater_1537_Pr4_S-0.65um_50_18]